MKWKRLSILLLVAALCAPSLSDAYAQRRAKAKPTRTAPASAKGVVGRGALPPMQLSQFTLPNGLNVILHRDTSTPVVAVNLWYHVGSKNEVPGKTGFAHLFEHMMFQGSKNFNDDYFFPLQEAGGTINGSTNSDRTNYYEVVPKNFLELALFLEADRLGGLLDAMTEEKLANQRDVVKNEKRQRVDNQPYGLVQAKVAETMYPAAHPYHWTTIGSLEDLTAASMDDVKEFFRRYYVPNNASLVVAGDFDPAEARRLVERYFGSIPRGADISRLNIPAPALEREIRLQEEDRVSLPRVYMYWHSVPAWTPDDAALDILANVLADGKGSRLYKSLVYDKQIAQEVAAFHNSRELAGQVAIVATAKPGKTLAELEAAINEELAKLKAQPPTAEEIERAYNERESAYIYGIQTVLGKADQLNQYHTFLRKPAYFEQDLARYRAVKAADVRRVANKYITDKRLVLTVIPRGPQNKGGETAATGPKTATPATPATSTQTPAAGATQPATPQTGAERPAGVQPQTKAEAASTQPAGSTPPGAVATAKPALKPEKKAHDMSKLPKPGPDPSTLALPQVQRRQLSNGLDVLIVEHHELPVVNMNMVFKAGAAADPLERAGLASMTAALLDDGTKTRSALEISNQLAAIGARLSTGAGTDQSSATLLSVTRHLDRALDIFSDVVASPSFPADELERMRASRMATFKQRRDNANAIAGVVYPAVLYGRQHPYGRPVIGNEESIGAVQGEEIRRFYQTYYRPNNSALIVVGDVTPDMLMPKLERAFGKWERGHVPAVDVTAAPVARERAGIYLVDRPGSAQSVLTIGQIGVPRSTPDYFPLLVLNRLLGGQFVSRVNMNLRENKGYTYGARTQFDYRRGAGLFAASADVQTFSTKESVFEFMKELRGIRGEIPVTPEELEYNKQGIIRSFPGNFETPAQIAARLEDVVLYDLPDDYFNTYLERVRAVTLEDINRAANRYLDPSRMAIVIVGDRKVIEPGLRSLENVADSITLIDTEGRTIPAGSGTSTTGGGGNQRQ
jgi:zinc protease